MSLMFQKKILIVDDDSNLQDMLADLLSQGGWRSLYRAESINEALALLARENIDLVVLDVMLPDGSGYDLALMIKENHDIPIIFLTAKSGDQDELNSFLAGGDDYLAKPFSGMVLIARIKNLLERYYKNTYGLVKVQNVSFDLDQKLAYVEGEEIPLTKTEAKIIQKLTTNLNCITPAEDIAHYVWGPNAFSWQNSLMVHIRNIRSKIEADPSKPKILVTVKGLGYKIIS